MKRAYSKNKTTYENYSYQVHPIINNKYFGIRNIFFLFVLFFFISSCIKNNDSVQPISSLNRKAIANKPIDTSKITDSTYDQFPQFDTIKNVTGMYYVSCIPWICNTSNGPENLNLLIQTDSIYNSLINKCTFPVSICNPQSTIDFSTKTLVGMQIGGGPWLETSEYKIYYNKSDSNYHFVLKINLDSSGIYSMIYMMKSFWATLPKLTTKDTVIFETKYYGKR